MTTGSSEQAAEPVPAGKEQAASGTRFRKGTSGNPAGRKPGTGQVAKFRRDIAKHVPGIVDALVKRAQEGDTGAARLLLERAIPPVRATEQPIEFDMPTEGTLTDKGRAVLEAAARGEIGAAQAAQLVGALSSLATLTTTDELATRLDALEARLGKPT